MEEGDKRIGNGGETSLRVSAGSPSWLFASNQRFAIELRPGETTIVSWKRLVKDAQNTPPHLTARKTEDSLEWNVISNSESTVFDECFQDGKSTVKQNGLFVNSEKLECINESVVLVTQQPRKRSKSMAKGLGQKVDGHLPSKHAKVAQGRQNFAATNALLEEESSVLLNNLADFSQRDLKLYNLLNSSVRSSIKKPANIGTKSEHTSHTGISNDNASISPLNSKDADNYRNVTILCSNIGNHTNTVATHQNYLEKSYCKQLESPVRELMTDNKKEAISVEVELREKRATLGGLPDLNLPVYPVQPEVSNCISKFQQEHTRT